MNGIGENTLLTQFGCQEAGQEMGTSGDGPLGNGHLLTEPTICVGGWSGKCLKPQSFINVKIKKGPVILEVAACCSFRSAVNLACISPQSSNGLS